MMKYFEQGQPGVYVSGDHLGQFCDHRCDILRYRRERRLLLHHRTDHCFAGWEYLVPEVSCVEDRI